MSRKKIIILSSVILFVVIAALLLYFFSIYRAESTLQKLVSSQSDGKLVLNIKKVNLDIFDLRFDFQEPELLTVDSLNAVSGYHVKAKKIILNVQSLLSVIRGKHVIIDSVLIEAPLIEVIKYKEGEKKKLSLPAEMNKVYQSLGKVLEVLNLNYLHIGDAQFRIYDRLNPDALPLHLSNINLTIDQVSKEKAASKDKFMFADRILLEIYNEDLVFADGFHGIRFKKFWIGTRTRKMVLDSCYIYGKPNDPTGAEFGLFIDSLHIKNLDFNALARENKIKFDSALCINPALKLNLQLKDKREKSALLSDAAINKDSIDQKLTRMLGNLDLGYVALKNASVAVVSKKNNKSNVHNAKNINFSITGLLANTNSPLPFEVKEIKFDVHNYSSFSPDSLYMIQFNDIIIQEDKIRLNDFSIQPTKWNKDRAGKNIKMDVFELDDIDWMALLYEHRIVAGHASLIRPEVNMVLPEARDKSAGNEKTNPFKILDKVRGKVSIGEFFIENGFVKIEEINGINLSVSNFYSGINVNQLLKSENELRVFDAVDTFSFSKGSFDNRSIKLVIKQGKYSKHSNSVTFGLIQETKEGLASGITLKNIRLQGINLHSSRDISVSTLRWKEADISINMLRNDIDKTKTKKAGIKTKFTISKLQGGPTSLYFIGDNIEASTQVNQISTDEIIIEPGRKPKINGLNIDGRLINLQQNKVQGNIGEFNIRDKNMSIIDNVNVFLPVGNEMISLFIPRFVFSADINQSINGKLTASFIELQQPVISFLPEKTAAVIKQETGEGKLPLLNIGRLTLLQPDLIGLPASVSQKLQFEPGNLNLNIIRINSDAESVKIDSITISAAKPFFKSDKIMLNPTGNEKIDFKGSAFVFKPADEQGKSKWSFNLDALNLSGLQMNTLQNDSIKQTIVLSNLNIGNLHMNDSSLSNPQEFLDKNNRFRISKGYIALENNNTNLELSNFSFNKATNSLAMDSLKFYPALDRDAFMKTQAYQTTHIQVHTGKINVKDIDFSALLKDTVISSRKVSISDLHLSAYKDKRLPFHHGVYKPMLTDLLLNIKPKLLIDSVVLKNGLIEYEEFNDKTLRYGHIKLSKIKGAIGGVRTFEPSRNDSLKFNIYARLLDTADLRLKYKQSYTDSLSGFNLKLIVSSFNLTALNPILLPFASAELKSGYLDTIRMSVIGRKYVAFGVMKMYYSDLNAQLVKQGDSVNRNFVTKSVSFLANRIVHTKNKRGIGHVYAERDFEKGFVNYWVKIVIGGVLTNTGVRSNKKQDRRYQKGVKFHDVPVIPDIPVDY